MLIDKRWETSISSKWFCPSHFDHRGEFLIFQKWNWSSLCIIGKKEAFISVIPPELSP